MNQEVSQMGKTRKGFLLTAGFLLLVLPLILIVVQQEQELRQRATELSFKTLPPNSPLPTDAECAVKVRRSSWEPRPVNGNANATNVYSTGYRLTGSELAQFGAAYEGKVTGDFTGTTDEIIQWAACKWGFDENIVRAQAAAESAWRQTLLGTCLGGSVQTETGGCHSVGLMQVKAANIPPSHPGTWPYARISTAFNIDYALAVRRACFDGKLSLPGVGYQAGDEWGCIGLWNTGAWHNTKAEAHIAKVKQALANNVWDNYGAGPLPTIPIATEPVPTLSVAPSEAPTEVPSTAPSSEPSTAPSAEPSPAPSVAPSVGPSPTSPYVVPTFFCLAAPCPITPSVEPTVPDSPSPTVSNEPEPTISGGATVTISPAPTEDPCASSASIATSPKSKHKEKHGGISGFFESLFKFFIELINLILRLIGGGTPNPGPVPTPVPSQAVPSTEQPLPTDAPTEAPQPTTDPCALPTAEPTNENPVPTENPQLTEIPLSVTAAVSPSGAVPTTSTAPSTAPSGTQTTPSTSPSTAPSISANPSEDPCAASASIATAKEKKKSKHHGHNGIISRFFKFILEFLTQLFKLIGQQPGNQNPVPSVAPTVGVPTVTQAVLSLAPTQTETPQPSEEPSTAPSTPAEPTPCGGPDTAVISGKVTTDSRYFTTLTIGITDAQTNAAVRTHTVNNPFANRDYSYSFGNLHPDKTYLVSVAACRVENNVQVCSKPIEITQCSGTIEHQVQTNDSDVACKIAGSGTANFAVKRSLLPTSPTSPATVPSPSNAPSNAPSIVPSVSPAPSVAGNVTPTVYFNLQRSR